MKRDPNKCSSNWYKNCIIHLERDQFSHPTNIKYVNLVEKKEELGWDFQNGNNLII